SGDVPTEGGARIGTVRHSRFFLHAISLDFPPDNPLNLPARLEAPLPQDFEKFLTENFPVSKLAKTFNGKYNRLIGL
ncbi:MAG: hypothetical protein IJU95_04145, partial [Treponema sp.]|nr:hypothetical protein [Treponema sp.]